VFELLGRLGLEIHGALGLLGCLSLLIRDGVFLDETQVVVADPLIAETLEGPHNLSQKLGSGLYMSWVLSILYNWMNFLF